MSWWGTTNCLGSISIKDLPEYVQVVALDRAKTTMGYDRVAALDMDLCDAINWVESPEGHSFWTDLYYSGNTAAFDSMYLPPKHAQPSWQEKFIEKYMLGEVYYHPSGMHYIFRPTEMSVQGDLVQIRCSLIQVLKSDFHKESIFMISEDEASKIRKGDSLDRDWLERCEVADNYVSKDYGATAGMRPDMHMGAGMDFDVSLSEHSKELNAAMERHREMMSMHASSMVNPMSNYSFDYDQIRVAQKEPKESLDELLGPDKKKSRRKAKSNEFKLQSHKKLDIF